MRRLGDIAPTQSGAFDASAYALVYCPRCDVVYLDPPPSENDLRTMYEQSDQFSDAHYTDPARVEAMLAFYGDAVRRLDLLGAGGRVLEVGSGLAWVSRACKAIDASATTVAQDVSAECATRCPWVDRYFVGKLDELDESQPFALASMTHVIEHLVDPGAMLGAIAQRLVPRGKVFVTAPYRPSGWRLAHGIAPWRAYSYMHVPAHVSYLSRTWFAREAPRRGLRLLHWDAQSEDGQAFEAVLERAA